MKIYILHLSDIHLKEKESDNPIIKREEKLFDSIKNELTDADKIFIIVTGDIAFSGQTSEFEFGSKIILALQKRIIDYTRKDCSIITIPGNHDCSFKPNKVRDHVLNSFDESGFVDIDDSVVNSCCIPQENYFNWKNTLYSKNSSLTTILDHKLVQILEYKKDNFNIVFNCYNTSWVSKRVEEYGKMVFPFSYFQESAFNNQSNLTINLIHHPFNWQAQHHYREFRNHLQQTGDIVLSGHEHEKGMHINYDEDGNFTGYIEAAALQDSKNGSNSNFNLIKFDLTEESYRLLRFTLKAENYSKESETESIKYFHRYNLSKKEFLLQASYREELNSPGAPFIHSEFGDISNIEQIYVHPDLRRIFEDTGSGGIKLPEIISSEELFNTTQEIKCIIVGDEAAGKTGLCKQFYNYYYERNLVPIWVDGEDLTETNKEKFRKDLKNLFIKQYEKKCHDKFDTLDNNKIVLIIDDFQKCPIKHQYRWKLVKNLVEAFPNIIITGNSLVIFQPLLSKDQGYLNVFENFNQFSILEFNVELRNQLISKWNRLGREDIESQNEVTQRNINAENKIRPILINNLLPSFPLNILTLLQAMEVGGSSENIFGNSYDLLIGNAINRSISKKDEHDFYSQFLTGYCYFLFENKLKELPKKDGFEKYVKSIADFKNITLNPDAILGILLKAKLVRVREDFVLISNRYIYYYFVAKYLSQNISSPDIKGIISNIAKRVYREEFYNVMLFLTHFSKEAFIVEELYNNANELLKDLPITRLEDDIQLINTSAESLPKLVLNALEADTGKLEVDKERADFEEGEKDIPNMYNSTVYDLNEDINSIDTLSKMILAIKTFEILGQVTQKNWGSSSGPDKNRFTKCTFNLALRTLNFYFKILIENKEGIVEYLRIVAGKKKIKDLEHLKTLSNKVMFQYAYVASFGIIKRVSNAIGHPQLENTYNEIINENPITSYKLINASISLDHYGEFPYKQIEDMFNDGKFNTNYLPKFLIQNFVYNNLRMFHSSIQKKQRICELVGIEVKTQIVAEVTSKEKKKG
jgi:GTPase SAR1 family protein/predicted MPP superfamily phosphohydrolase